MALAVVIVIILAIFAIVSALFLLGWHSTRDKNMLGGIVVMLIVLAIFFVVLILAVRQREQLNQTVQAPIIRIASLK